MLDIRAMNPKHLAEEGVKMTILHPVNGTPFLADESKKPKKGEEPDYAYIKVRGSFSETAQRKSFAKINELLKKRTQAKTKGGKPLDVEEAPTIEETIDSICQELAENTIEMHGVGDAATGWVPKTQQDFFTVYKELVWLRDQAKAFCDDIGNFIKS